MLAHSMGAQYVALGSSEIKRIRSRWRLKYREGKLTRALTLVLPEQVGLALERVVASSRAAAPGTVPLTMNEAKQMVTLRKSQGPPVKLVIAMLITVASIGVTLVLRQPLFLIVMAVGSLFIDRLVLTPYLLLAGENLWWLDPTKEPKGIPLAQVLTVRTSKPHSCIIETSDPGQPLIAVSDAGGTMHRRLQAWLSGTPQEPLMVAAPVPQVNVTTRCTLCGRPGPEAAQGVYLCDLCAARTILEARQGGHGLTGKETKPM
jgi:hypothetical protein